MIKMYIKFYISFITDLLVTITEGLRDGDAESKRKTVSKLYPAHVQYNS